MLKSINSNSIRSFFTKGNDRTLRAKKNVTISLVCRSGSILVSFLVIPLTLGYVGTVEYGIWMTISAIINWFGFFDIGLGNGLRNQLAVAIARDEKHTARVYVSSVYAIITAISVLMFLGFLIVSIFIPWKSVLNTNVVPEHELFRIVNMVFFFFCMGFVLKLLSSVLAAIQQYALNDIIGLISQVLGLGAMYLLVKTSQGSLYNLCLLYSVQNVVVLLIATVVLFSGSLKQYKPSLKFIDLKKTIPLLNLGIKFFINQILYLIISQAPIILVVQFFGPEDVTIYNLSLRYTTVTSMLYIMVLSPFLAAFTEAYTKNDFEWIKSTIKKINLIWLMVSIGTIGMILVNRIFFHIWLGDSITIPQVLIIAMGISSILGTKGSTYSLFLNGIGVIKLQLYVLAGQALLFIPISYVFYKSGLGLSSIVLSQILLSIASVFFYIIQYKKIINQNASGIWLK